MKRSTSRILTTHTGSLPRSPELQELLRQREDQGEIDEAQFHASVHDAVGQIVARQQDTGVDVVNDGEQGRSQYATYVKERLTGFEGERLVRSHIRLDDADFPEFHAAQTHLSSRNMRQPACTGPIAWKDWPAVERDIRNLKEAAAGQVVEEVFMTAASPGVIAKFPAQRALRHRGGIPVCPGRGDEGRIQRHRQCRAAAANRLPRSGDGPRVAVLAPVGGRVQEDCGKCTLR